MVEVNGAYKHGRYEKIWLHTLCVMSNLKVFATQNRQTDGQTAGRPAGQTNTTYYYTDPYDTHMDQKTHVNKRDQAHAPSHVLYKNTKKHTDNIDSEEYLDLIN